MKREHDNRTVLKAILVPRWAYDMSCWLKCDTSRFVTHDIHELMDFFCIKEFPCFYVLFKFSDRHIYFFSIFTLILYAKVPGIRESAVSELQILIPFFHFNSLHHYLFYIVIVV